MDRVEIRPVEKHVVVNFCGGKLVKWYKIEDDQRLINLRYTMKKDLKTINMILHKEKFFLRNQGAQFYLIFLHNNHYISDIQRLKSLISKENLARTEAF